ncbi:MAG: peptidyl-prolyl cis-trans isomerase [Deltaproteobacteria bacterium]|nr:peptidyl-prolyl cis-trans isomerase [Deltaproteobacteria bacterium]
MRISGKIIEQSRISSLRFQRVVIVGCIFFIAQLLVACQRTKNSPRDEPKVVAVVNGEKISVSEFQAALDDIKKAGKGFFSSTKGSNRIKRELLERIIDTRLLLQEARKKRIVLDPEILEASIKLIFDQYPPGGMEEELLRKGKSLKAYRQEKERSLLLYKLLKREIVDRIAVSHQEVEKYFLDHQSDFREPEQVRVRQIVTKAEEEAEKIRKLILRGESFVQLAKMHSLGPEAKQGGDLGYFPKGRMPPAIEEACFKLWSSHVSKVVTSPYGFHLFQLVDRRPARELTLEQASQAIEQKLTAEKIREAESYYIRTLREAASIERDLSLLERIQ